MKALAAPACRLRVLNVEYNNFEAADIALFADGLAANRTLRHLSLKGNIVTGIGVEVGLELTLRLQLTVLVLVIIIFPGVLLATLVWQCLNAFLPPPNMPC